MSLVAVFARLLLGVAAGFAAYKGLPAFSDVRLTATTMVALSGTLTGFIMTALSLLVSAADRPFLSNLRLTGHFQVLLRGLIRSAGLWICVIVIAMTGHFVDGKCQILVVSVATGLLFYTLLEFLSAGSKFAKVIIELSRK